jgi:hypothetical protein
MALSEHDAAKLKSFHDHRTETYKSMISISVELFKFLALLNGGAAAGAIASFQVLLKSIAIQDLKISIGLFIAGLVLTGLAITCSYLTQLELYKGSVREEENQHPYFLFAALSCCLLSLSAFCWGALNAVIAAHGGGAN